MKRALILLCSLTLLGAAVGCDEVMVDGVPVNVQSFVSGLDAVKIDFISQNGDFGGGDQIQQRLMDGSCDGDGAQYQYGGSNGGGNGGAGGNGDQLQLRDGSCADGD